MKPDILFYFCVTLLCSFGSAQNGGNKTLDDHAADVNILAENGKLINGIFKPSKKGYIGDGGFAFTFKGILLPIDKEIVMKFTKLEKRKLAEAEYEMYTYLHAINNATVELYGIPSISYYGEWEGQHLIMMGLTLLDKEVNTKQLLENDVNILIVLRDFILTSKYVHCCGIRHDDVKLANMMILHSKTFLIDFNLGHKMNVKSMVGTLTYKSRRALRNGHRYPKDDWESLLYSMCVHLNVKFHWIGKNAIGMLPIKEDTVKTIEKIETIRSERLKNIFISLAVHIFDDGDKFESDDEEHAGINSFTHSDVNVEDRFPDYDFYYKLVNDEIKEFNDEEPVMFSWLMDTARDDAIDYLNAHPIPDIAKIRKPTHSDYVSFEYPTVDKEYFTRAYKDWKPHASDIVNNNSPTKSAGSSAAESSTAESDHTGDLGLDDLFKQTEGQLSN